MGNSQGIPYLPKSKSIQKSKSIGDQRAGRVAHRRNSNYDNHAGNELADLALEPYAPRNIVA